jgi:stage II sporulation protein AA (anti-sigma F factor antagonist)
VEKQVLLTTPNLKTVRVENLKMVQSSPEDDALRDGIFSMQLRGPVAMATVPEIRKLLLGAAKKRTVKVIRLDFSRVTILDTSGVAMLVETWRGLARRGGALRLSGLSENARKLIQLAGLDQIFEIRDDPGSRLEYGS